MKGKSMNKVAAVVGPALGLKGDVVVRLHTDSPDLLTSGTVFYCEGVADNQLTLAHLRTHNGKRVMHFEEVNDRNAAETLRGRELLIESHPEPDAWYPEQLKGLRACTLSGYYLGTVHDLILAGAQDLLEIETDRGMVLVPFVHQLVPEVNIDGGVIILDPPAGLFDDAPEPTSPEAPDAL